MYRSVAARAAPEHRTSSPLRDDGAHGHFWHQEGGEQHAPVAAAPVLALDPCHPYGGGPLVERQLLYEGYVLHTRSKVVSNEASQRHEVTLC